MKTWRVLSAIKIVNAMTQIITMEFSSEPDRLRVMETIIQDRKLLIRELLREAIVTGPAPMLEPAPVGGAGSPTKVFGERADKGL